MNSPVALLVGVLSAAFGFSTIADTTLDLLLQPGATLTVGPLTFSDFTYAVNGPDMPAANLVSVAGFTGPGLAGILFSTPALWQDTRINSGLTATARIDYKAISTSFDPLIQGAKLFTVPMGVMPNPGGSAEGDVTVNESLLIVMVGNVPTLRSFFSQDDKGASTSQFGQMLFFPNRKEIDTVTDLGLLNGGATPFVGGIAESFILPDDGRGQEAIAIAALIAASRCLNLKRGRDNMGSMR
jgi:hypothetical protein